MGSFISFPLPIAEIIAEYAGENEFLPWVKQNQDKINWDKLSENPAAIHLLEKNLDKINWVYLSKNPAAIHLLEKNPDKINKLAKRIISKNKPEELSDIEQSLKVFFEE